MCTGWDIPWEPFVVPPGTNGLGWTSGTAMSEECTAWMGCPVGSFVATSWYKLNGMDSHKTGLRGVLDGTFTILVHNSGYTELFRAR